MDKQRVKTNTLISNKQPAQETEKVKILPGPRVIASPLIDHKLAGAFADLVSQRWDNWDLAPWMPYLVDVCDESLLPWLADQFNVEGVRGFGITGDEKQQRELIKKSISLHRYLGTPWAIKEACKTIGFPIVSIEEGVRLEDNIKRDEDWARFRVVVGIGDERRVTDEEIRKLYQFIDFYKNERSELVDIQTPQKFSDTIFTNDTNQRELLSLNILNFYLSPDPAILSPNGAAITVNVESNCPWLIKQTVIEWPDETGDKLYLAYTGEAGNGEITITADPNYTADRKVTMDVFHPDGIVIGHLTISQPLKWHNAYSTAYSRAYNLTSETAKAYSLGYSDAYSRHDYYIRVSPNHVFMEQEDGKGEIQVISNVNWNID